MRAIGMAPASRRRATSVASSLEGGAERRPTVPAVHTTPESSMESLTLNGTPHRGPVSPPRASASSAARAAAGAGADSTSITA